MRVSSKRLDVPEQPSFLESQRVMLADRRQKIPGSPVFGHRISSRPRLRSPIARVVASDPRNSKASRDPWGHQVPRCGVERISTLGRDLGDHGFHLDRHRTGERAVGDPPIQPLGVLGREPSSVQG